MYLNFDPLPYPVWAALLVWLKTIGVVFGLGLTLAIISSLISRGKSGPGRVLRSFGLALADFVKMSPRRIFALSSLTFKEAVRRRALLVFVIFAVLFMFAGWFLTDTNTRAEDQVKVSVTFVLRAITWLVTPVMLLLACWGVPDDIKRRSLHTVVTKPVRRNEVVLGRMLGYTMIGTVIIVLMGMIGYLWIERQVTDEKARANLVSRVPVYGHLFFTDPKGRPQFRGVNTGDLFDFRSYIKGPTQEGREASAIWRFADFDNRYERGDNEVLIETAFQAFRTQKGDMQRGLKCLLTVANRMQKDMAWDLGMPLITSDLYPLMMEGRYAAAAAKLESIAQEIDENTLKTKAGTRTMAGVNTAVDPDQPVTQGEYMGLARGANEAALHLKEIKKFWRDQKGVAETELAWMDDLQAALETYKETSEAISEVAVPDDSHRKPLAKAMGEVADLFRKHEKQLRTRFVDLVSELPVFEVIEFRSNLIRIPNKLPAPRQDDTIYDLYEDLCRGKMLRIEAKCLDSQQLLGMARPDLFIRQPDRPFASGYFKAVLGIWLQVVMIVVLAVMASCFVKGPVATLLTFALFILGTKFRVFMAGLVTRQFAGGGPIETWYRLFTGKGPQSPMPETAMTDTVRFIDNGILGVLRYLFELIPNFGPVGQMPQYVANGYDIPWNASLLPAVMIALGLILPCVIIGHMSLKLREIEAK